MEASQKEKNHNEEEGGGKVVTFNITSHETILNSVCFDPTTIHARDQHLIPIR